MKITLFSSNQPRHLNLANELSRIADTVYFISEVNTVFPGKVDDFYRKSETMQEYFQHVIAAEKKLFGNISFLPGNVKTLALKSGDLNMATHDQLAEAMSSDLYIVFGASYIKGWLIDFLVSQGAINIHMGLSPYYRGSSCNFWALNDEKPEYVGATIHLLSQGLDSGDMLFHCVPEPRDSDSPFEFTMRSVAVAHSALAESIEQKRVLDMKTTPQNNLLEVRYTRNAEFTELVAREFLDRKSTINLNGLKYPDLLNPVFS